MKKITGLLAICIAFLLSCEEDDICLDTTTPRMNIAFKSSTTGEKIQLDTLVISQLNIENTFEGFIFASQDSALIQLLPNAENSLQFRIARSLAMDANSDEFLLSFDRKQVFQSKACGFAFNYENMNTSLASNSILDSIRLEQNEFNDEQTTVLSLFFAD